MMSSTRDVVEVNETSQAKAMVATTSMQAAPNRSSPISAPSPNEMVEENADGGGTYWLWKLFTNWTSRSPTVLRSVEERILSYMNTSYQCFYVDIGETVGTDDKIWTIAMNTLSTEVPLVMLHGLGGGIALWILNYDAFAADRPVYAMDIIGFGRSSRPTFDKDAKICEQQLVESIERWRQHMGIYKMLLLGHSMGGFLAASYAITYPQHTHHLILADPWGFSDRAHDVANRPQIPFWARASAYAIPPLNPLWPLRAAGPFGKWIIQKARADVMHKFADIVKDDDNLLPQYIHQCNVQEPTGETAFHTMMSSFAWAKHPMINRIDQLHDDVPITFIFGAKSWVDARIGIEIKQQRTPDTVDIKIIDGAGHHVYAIKYEVFNDMVNEVCNRYGPANPSANEANKILPSDTNIHNNQQNDAADEDYKFGNAVEDNDNDNDKDVNGEGESDDDDDEDYNYDFAYDFAHQHDTTVLPPKK